MKVIKNFNNLIELFTYINYYHNIHYCSKNINSYFYRKNFYNLLQHYGGNDWIKYINFDSEYYKKNIIINNDNIELSLICWNSLQCSKVHCHSNFCIMKVLKGELIEEKYINNNNNLIMYDSKIMQKNMISHINNNIWHKIINPDYNELITLNLYLFDNIKK